VLVNVQPCSRISGRKAEAENRRRSTRAAPVPKAGNTMAHSAFPWNSGMAQ
jgi:hypothetical protein